MERPYLNKWKQYLNEDATQPSGDFTGDNSRAESMLSWVNEYIKKHNFKLVSRSPNALEYKHANLKGTVFIQINGGTTNTPRIEITVSRAGLRVNDPNDEYLYNEMIFSSQWMDDRGPALEKVLASFGVK